MLESVLISLLRILSTTKRRRTLSLSLSLIFINMTPSPYIQLVKNQADTLPPQQKYEREKKNLSRTIRSQLELPLLLNEVLAATSIFSRSLSVLRSRRIIISPLLLLFSSRCVVLSPVTSCSWDGLTHSTTMTPNHCVSCPTNIYFLSFPLVDSTESLYRCSIHPAVSLTLSPSAVLLSFFEDRRRLREVSYRCFPSSPSLLHIIHHAPAVINSSIIPSISICLSPPTCRNQNELFLKESVVIA